MIWMRKDLRPHVEYILDAVRLKHWESVDSRVIDFIKHAKNKHVRKSLDQSGIYYWY